jgi:hypothetical protein
LDHLRDTYMSIMTSNVELDQELMPRSKHRSNPIPSEPSTARQVGRVKRAWNPRPSCICPGMSAEALDLSMRLSNVLDPGFPVQLDYIAIL